MLKENEGIDSEPEIDVRSLKQENRQLRNELARLKAVDQFVREREQVLQIILDSATDAIITIDEDSSIIHASAAVFQVFGYTAAEIAGQSVTILIPDGMRDQHLMGISRFTRTGKPQNSWKGLRFEGLHRNGHLFPIEVSFGAVRRPDGSLRFTGIIRDVTAAVEAEQRMRNQLDELAHRQRLLSVGEMATGLAHELNQPLLAMCLQADAAVTMLPDSDGEEADDQSELRTTLQEIADQAHRASRIIRSVRSLVRREGVARQSVSLSKIVESVLPICEHCCRQGNSKLSVNIPKDLPRVDAADIQIGQVLANLVQNAVTAMSDVSETTRSVEVTARQVESDLIEVRVRDFGRGIQNDSADQLFESFFTTGVGGLGMGLVICRSIVEEHGGHIRAANAPDQGAIFTFTLRCSSHAESDAHG